MLSNVFLMRILLSVPLAEEPPGGAAARDPFAGGMDPLTTVILVVLLILIIWWLLRSQVNQVEPMEHHDHDEGVHHHHEMLEDAPAMAEEMVSPAQPDDLKVLEGVGPKVESVLQAAGYATYASLAAADVGRLQEILDEAGYQYMNPGSWPQQARLAAEGNWEALKALQDSLNAGRA